MDLVLIFMDVEGLMYYIVGSMSSREQMDYTGFLLFQTRGL